MDINSMGQLVGQVSFPIAMVIFLLYWVWKTDKQNRTDTNEKINILNDTIKQERSDRIQQHDEYEKKMERQTLEHEKDREVFRMTSEAFQKYVEQNTNLNADVASIKKTQESMKSDLDYLKENINK